MHTKGSWKISEHLDTGESVVRDADDIIVANCGVDQWDHRQEPEMKANAKLIAAAPEMVEACKLSLEAINQRLSIDGGETGAFNSELKAVLALEAAIKQAEV